MRIHGPPERPSLAQHSEAPSASSHTDRPVPASDDRLEQTPNPSLAAARRLGLVGPPRLRPEEALPTVTTRTTSPKRTPIVSEGQLHTLANIAAKAYSWKDTPLDRINAEPIKYTDEHGVEREYKLDKVVTFGRLGGTLGHILGIGGGGAKAFLLKPSKGDGPGIVVYHGSDDVPAVLMDIDPRGIGRSLLNWRGNKINSEIAKWMQENGQHGIVSTGHSLGGALASMTALYGPKGVQVKAVTFGSPGLNKDAYSDWQKKKSQGQAPEIVSFEGEHDSMAQFGWRKVGKLFRVAGESDHNNFLFGDDKIAKNPRGGYLGFHGIQFVGETPQGKKSFAERLADLSDHADKAAEAWSEARKDWRSKNFWTSALHRTGATLLSPVVFTLVALKRLLLGSKHNNPLMRWGLLAPLSWAGSKLFDLVFASRPKTGAGPPS